MKKYLGLIAILILIAACSTTPKETAESLPSTTPAVRESTPVPTVTPAATTRSSPTPAGRIFELNYRLGRGVNLGNALEAPTEGEWGMMLEEEFFELIANAGFNAVRIPIRFSDHAEVDAPYTIDEEFFARIDWAVENAVKNKLVAVIDMHHYLEIMEDPAGHKDRFIALWEQIAQRYQKYPDEQVFYELLNEPNTNLGGDIWNEIIAETIPVVREHNPTRPIVVAPGGWGGFSELENLELPDDPNLIVTVHYYLPFQFTHQGAEWVDNSEPWLGTTWDGNRADLFVMNTDFYSVYDWGQRNQLPIFLGEFGAYSKADMDSRTRWTNAVARMAESYGFSWAYWEFGAGFGVYDREAQAWREALLQALIPAK